MNQADEEEESIYRALEEETIDVDCLLVEPRSDQVSVSGVWCFEEDNLGKSMKIEDVPFKLGVPDSNINMEGVDTTKLNVLDSLPHDVGVENLLTANGDDYLLDIGFVEHGACIDYGSSEGLDTGISSSRSRIPGFSGNDKGSFGISNVEGSECQNGFLGNCVFGTSAPFAAASFESENMDLFKEIPNSFECDDNKDERASCEVTAPICRESVVANKRSRKPTKRYIDESSNLSLKICKKRQVSSGTKGMKRAKHRHQQTEPKAKTSSSEILFDKAIQVPFVSQGPTERQKDDPPTVMEHGMESEEDSETTMRCGVGVASGNQRKLHRLWTVSEVKKLIDGVAHFGVGKWTHIKRLLFSSSVHRTPVDLKDKWRNLLKASCALNGSNIEEEQKRSQPWRPLPKSILCRVRELATVYPYPREPISNSNSNSNSNSRIKGNQVSVL